jgi:DNA-binding transcriptional MerR regulator
MRIGELAQKVGVSTDTVRFYERTGWLPRAPRNRDNSYRQYADTDVEHLRLLIDLRRLEVPLDQAARIAGWCHSGHCAESTAELPEMIAARRQDIAERMTRLAALDKQLADLADHLRRSRRALSLLTGAEPCCQAASAVLASAEGCECCAGAAGA